MPDTKRESRKLQSDDFCTDYVGPIPATISNPWWRKHLKEEGLGHEYYWVWRSIEEAVGLKKTGWNRAMQLTKGMQWLNIDLQLYIDTEDTSWSEQLKQTVIWKASLSKVLKFTAAGIAKACKTQLKKHFPGLPVSSL